MKGSNSRRTREIRLPTQVRTSPNSHIFQEKTPRTTLWKSTVWASATKQTEVKKLAQVNAHYKKAQRASQEKTARLPQRVRKEMKSSKANRCEPHTFAMAQQCTVERLLRFLRKFRNDMFTDTNKVQALTGPNARLSQEGAAGAHGYPANKYDKEAA